MSLDKHDDTENVDHGDVLNSPNYFGNVLSATMNRREVMRGGLSAAVTAGFGGSLLSACASDGPGSGPTVNVKSIARSKDDRVVIPSDYSAYVLFATGDLLNGAGGDKTLQTITGDEMASRAGDHHDGMYFYGLNAAGALDRSANDRGVIAINFENINQQFLHAAGPTADATTKARTVADEVVKEINAHGVGLVEVKKNASGKFEVVSGSTISRRVTPETPMRLAGPVAGSQWVKTKFSTDGSQSRGTLNNCAYGYTPWGTYLTCEENWAGYFDNASTATPGIEYSRYGIAKSQGGSYRWATAGADDRFARWQLNTVGADASADYRNEANTFGWVVEIDPVSGVAAPVKRTTFGRMAHECAYPSIITAGKKFAFYQGDDARFEYVYKFVPNKVWDAADAGGGYSAGDKYLNDGVLYVAKYNADGSGSWIPLVAGTGALTAANGFADQAEVLVKTRAAADAVGATKMDRPEWCSVDHGSGDVFITLTNNTSRTAAQVDAANPRASNAAGHILRMREAGSDPAATTFSWTIFVFGSAATNASSNLSELTAENDFASPDGIYNDARGLLWIQTDNGHTNEMGLLCNNQMLVTIPPSDFNTRPVIRRFLVGPAQCEITGIDMTPDGKTMFVNIQHPGEETAVADVNGTDGNVSKYASAWPYDRADATKAGTKAGRPRSATLVISKKDGGQIGV
ncbi:MAG: PhoX family phosphatase [Stagnimonas sp.]|nr:PhoX family phosphatase [Stagnimonas sp.]